MTGLADCAIVEAVAQQRVGCVYVSSSRVYGRGGSKVDTEKTDIYLALLAEMYNELRSYRDKEFQTFLFAVPIIGAGFVEKVTSIPLAFVLTLFCGVVCFYIVQNYRRTGRLMTIVSIQGALGANKMLGTLNPQMWAKKPFHKRLGTMVYLFLIIIEVIILWLVVLEVFAIAQPGAVP
jgi:uncharacterized membrane protein YeaQ/YmgE (transglycosylase-associated protein family)